MASYGLTIGSGVTITSGITLPSIESDDYFEYATLLLPGNGTNTAQNNTFLDGSTNNFTITRNGNTTQGTFSPFSQTGWGNYFDGSGGYLTANGGTTANLGTTWTIECWLYPNNVSGTGAIVNVNINTANQGINIYRSGATITVDNGVTAGTGPSGGTLVANTWQHVAVVADGTNTRIYLNGSQVGSTFPGTVTSGTPTHFWIGSSFTGLTAWAGYISNARIVKGVAVYTGTFTPPTSPLAATQSAGTNISAITGTQTSLLTCQSNRFIDNSTANSGSGFPITVNGNTSVVAFSPFNPTSAWSASTVGGSGYFDGTGDYLSNTSSSIVPTTGDFTIEGWVYPSQVSTVQYILGTGGGTRLDVYINSSAYVGVQTGGSYRDSSTTKIIANAWNYIAITRTGSTYAIFVNGVSQTIAGTGTMASTITNTPTYIGTYSGTTNNFTGYICGLRVSTVVRTGLTTLPTSPYTSDANTSLLLNFTNAGIYDATSKNDLETVGNAQISTTQSKWGGSSMSFDGTGDWLLIPDQPIRRIGTGNFTIEGWVYRNSSGTYGLIGKGTGTTGWLVSLNSSNQVVFTYGSSTITSTGTVSATTWTHIAVVREGTSTNQTKIYINGTNDGTGTVSTDFNQTNSMYVGADRTGGSAANVYMQDVRVTNYARYTTNFTVPTAAFPTF